jgi:signal transduction histidine kinase/CheY-like chemotaxis protein
MDMRILILATRGRDASVIARLITRRGQEWAICTDVSGLAEAIPMGCGAVVVTEESLGQRSLEPLADLLARQPPWSDIPFILLSTKRTGRRTPDAQRLVDALGNVVILERPIHGDTLLSAITSALRVRGRQYEAKQHLDALVGTEERLRELNASLEERIAYRTDELTRANNRLTAEIAERERAQATLAQVQKMEAVGQLTGGIAHDFNNLLAAISGNLQLLERNLSDARTAKLTANALLAVDRATKLTQQLLVFSRAEKPRLEVVNLNTLVHNLRELLDRTIGSAVAVTIAAADEVLYVTVDPNQFELALLNLAINARDAMADGGKLHISVTSEGGKLARVVVADTGSGIPAHLLQKIFDPFFTTKPPGKGTGLGLSQVYAIVGQAGGSIVVDSSVSVGTTFTITLPLTAGAVRTSGYVRSRPSIPKADSHILVVDDDDGVRLMIEDTLASLGFRVSAASSGDEGLDQFRSLSPDLVVVDYLMPGMNGVELVKRIREIAPDCPIILATGYADMDAVGRVVDSRFILRKPFRSEDLHLALTEALAG